MNTCCNRTSKLFHGYDADGSGAIESDEFLQLIKVLIPDMTIQDVDKTFKLVGAGDTINEDEFFVWCLKMFSNFDDEEFVYQIQHLLDSRMTSTIHD